MAITSDFTNIATTTRASKAWDPGAWDFVSGSAVGALVEYAANAPRITSSGLLVEEASTNEITNPRAEGAIAGTPGTAPTGWSISNADTIISVVGSGTEDGWPYVDYKWAGTISTFNSVFFQNTSTIAVGATEDWTASVSVKIVAGDTTNLTAIDHVHQIFGGAGTAYVTDTLISSVDSTRRRFHVTGTGHTGSTYGRHYISLNGSGACDITLRIYAPQMENKAYPTSPVLPTALSPAASTRNADEVRVAVGSWYSAPYSMYLELVVPPHSKLSGTLYAATLGDGGGTDVAGFGFSLTNGPRFYMAAGGAGQVSLSNTKPADGALMRAAVAVDTNDVSFSSYGDAQQYDTSVTVPSTPTTLYLHEFGTGTADLSQAYIKDVRFWPRRLTNAELEALVGN